MPEPRCGHRIEVSNAEGVSWTTTCVLSAGHDGYHVSPQVCEPRVVHPDHEDHEGDH